MDVKIFHKFSTQFTFAEAKAQENFFLFFRMPRNQFVWGGNILTYLGIHFEGRLDLSYVTLRTGLLSSVKTISVFVSRSYSIMRIFSPLIRIFLSICTTCLFFPLPSFRGTYRHSTRLTRSPTTSVRCLPGMGKLSERIGLISARTL